MPVVAGAAIAGAGALAGGGLSFLGAQSQSKAIRDSMNRYLGYLADQRRQFLTATSPIRAVLEKYAQGDISADPRQATINEAYGGSLRDITTDVLGAGVQPGGTYTPGARDRTAMLAGQNLAASRAQNLRDLSMADQQMALSTLPTYEPGLPATPMASPDVFSAGTPPSIASFLGSSLTNLSQPFLNAAAYGPIYAKMAAANPYLAANPQMYSPVYQGTGALLGPSQPAPLNLGVKDY